MKKKIVLFFMCVILFSGLLSELVNSPQVKAAERPMGDAFFETFDSHNTDRWSKAGIWSNEAMFNATWYPEQVTFSDGLMNLQIDKEDDESATPPYKAGELRTNDFYQYGLFEVSMKPAKSTGTVSSLFTYTGPWDWENDPWDEIDIEFLGKDTTRVQFNYFTDGVGGNEHYHELGFDAADDFNTYAFEWRPDSIRWFVNGELVHTATENIPQTPQKIMMNLWPGIGVDEWTGRFNGEDTPVITQYDWVKYTPLEQLDCFNEKNQKIKKCEGENGKPDHAGEKGKPDHAGEKGKPDHAGKPEHAGNKGNK